jgi:endonuclease III related protein
LKQTTNLFVEIFDKLLKTFGPRHWWPGDTHFEIMVGAILTQNTSWVNVEKAIQRLKEEQVLTARGIHQLKKSELAPLIQSSGTFRIKTDRLKAMVGFLMEEYEGKLVRMEREPLGTLRDKLLSVKGIGPETADSILLYALGKPIFVVDAYTRRILLRHGMITGDASYGEVQDLFMNNLPLDVKLFNEYHALLVHLGKTSCKKDPKCAICPLSYMKSPRGRGFKKASGRRQGP